MRIYELTIILSPNLDKDQVNAELDKLKEQIESGGGKVSEIQHLGLKRIAFNVKGSNQGNYFTIYYEGTPDIFGRLEQGMKLNEAVLRYLVIVLKPSEYSVQPEAKEATSKVDEEEYSEDIDIDEEGEDLEN
jgi:small subunit ribosomal protein S6